MNNYRDALEVGFYSEDTIYGPLYYGYEPHFLAIRHGRRLEKELPEDTILVLLTASPEIIRKRMDEKPHEYQVIKKEDIPTLLKAFEEEFQASTIHAKIKIDTSKFEPEQVLKVFIKEVRQKHLTSLDLVRILLNE
jgi:hypothetical protein